MKPGIVKAVAANGVDHDLRVLKVVLVMKVMSAIVVEIVGTKEGDNLYARPLVKACNNIVDVTIVVH